VTFSGVRHRTITFGASYLSCGNRGGSTWGARGVKPPYLPNTHEYPPKPLLDFWDETMKRKR